MYRCLVTSVYRQLQSHRWMRDWGGILMFPTVRPNHCAIPTLLNAKFCWAMQIFLPLLMLDDSPCYFRILPTWRSVKCENSAGACSHCSVARRHDRAGSYCRGFASHELQLFLSSTCVDYPPWELLQWFNPASVMGIHISNMGFA